MRLRPRLSRRRVRALREERGRALSVSPSARRRSSSFLALLARGIARVALELLLVFEALLLSAATAASSASRAAPPGAAPPVGAPHLRRRRRAASAASASALRRARSVSRSARASRIALALGFALDDGGIVRVVFRDGRGTSPPSPCEPWRPRPGGRGNCWCSRNDIVSWGVSLLGNARAHATRREKRQWSSPQCSILRLAGRAPASVRRPFRTRIAGAQENERTWR